MGLFEVQEYGWVDVHKVKGETNNSHRSLNLHISVLSHRDQTLSLSLPLPLPLSILSALGMGKLKNVVRSSDRTRREQTLIPQPQDQRPLRERSRCTCELIILSRTNNNASYRAKVRWSRWTQGQPDQVKRRRLVLVTSRQFQ